MIATKNRCYPQTLTLENYIKLYSITVFPPVYHLFDAF